MRTIIPIFLLFVGNSVLPSMNIALKQSEISEIKDKLIMPLIGRSLINLGLPDNSISNSGLKCTLTNAILNAEPINNKDIKLILVRGTNTIKNTGEHISGKIAMHAKCTYLLIPFEADINLEIKDISYGGIVSMAVDSNGRPTIEISGIVMTVNPANIKISFSNTPIKVILDLIVPLLKSTVINSINTLAQSQIPQAFSKITSDVISTLPLDIDYSDDTGIHSVMARTPLCEEDRIVFYLWAYGIDLDDPSIPPFNPKVMPDFGPCSQGIQVIISEYVPDSLFYADYTAGILESSINIDLPNSNGIFNCSANDIPDFEFKNEIAVIYYGKCDFNGFYKGKAASATITGYVNGNAIANVKNEKIFYQIVKLTYTITNYMKLTVMSKAEVSKIVEIYLSTLQETLNDGPGKEGIELPMIDGIDYSESTSTIKQGYMEICSTPIINSLLS